MRGGRGSGKTRAGAETLASWVLESEPGDWAIVAPTYRAGVNVCVEGESGVLRALGCAAGHSTGGAVEAWNRSMGELRLTNGSAIFVDGADDGALRIQGKNLRGAWCDEVGLWRQWDLAWNESLAYAIRKPPARLIATGTPKGKQGLVAQLLEDGQTVVTHLRTKDNAANLSEAALADLERRYGGTRRGRQELEGEVLDEVEGALWSWQMIERDRVREHPDLVRIVVAVDPAASAGEDSDETGIVVAGLGADNHGYVLDDLTCRLSPDGWARAAVAAYRDRRADRIVAEVNNGGEMVEHVIRTVDPSVSYRPVHASRGKQIRAEPIAALYEQGKVHHVGAFSELESQLTTWTPEDRDSPDRLDALVWALSELMLGLGVATAPLFGTKQSRHKIY